MKKGANGKKKGRLSHLASSKKHKDNDSNKQNNDNEQPQNGNGHIPPQQPNNNTGGTKEDAERTVISTLIINI